MAVITAAGHPRPVRRLPPVDEGVVGESESEGGEPARYWSVLCALARLVAITTASGAMEPWTRPRSEDAGKRVLLTELILSRGRLGCRRP